MCGRVDIHTPPAQLARALEAQLAAGIDPDGRPSFNVGPSRAIPAIVETDEHVRVLDLFRWGLVPHWAKDPKAGGYKMINARAETVTTSRSYRTALSRRRCLIVVDGFFEWAAGVAEGSDTDREGDRGGDGDRGGGGDPKGKARKAPKTPKIPYYFTRADGLPLTFAGLWETWWDKSRSPTEPDPETYLQTCTIVTTQAGPDMEDIHNRMPVIIEKAQRELWLDPSVKEVEVVTGLLVPSPAGTLIKHVIDTEVNNVRNDGPHIIVPAPVPERQVS